MLYPQNGGRIVAIDFVTSLHSMYSGYCQAASHAQSAEMQPIATDEAARSACVADIRHKREPCKTA